MHLLCLALPQTYCVPWNKSFHFNSASLSALCLFRVSDEGIWIPKDAKRCLNSFPKAPEGETPMKAIGGW